jgi:modulator of FtsH protease HflK
VKRTLIWILALVAIYLASGFYIVRGNEQALVRRFGRARLPLAASGLHFDLPWPFTQIDRVNVNQVQTISVGVTAPSEPIEGAGFLQETFIDRQGEFLTGDKNVLNLAVNVQYRIADPYAYLFLGKSPEIGLKLLVEALVTDAVARSGVDYVHPLGLNELRGLLTRRTHSAAEQQPWGILVDDVTISGAFPPVEVKASFLDVSNARAEKDRGVHEEQARAEKRLAAARAESRQRLDRAHAAGQARVEFAKGSADRFRTIVAEFRRDAESTGQSADAVRRRTMQRLFSSTMEQLLPRFAGKVLIDPHDPVDLTIFPPPEPDATQRPRE